MNCIFCNKATKHLTSVYHCIACQAYFDCIDGKIKGYRFTVGLTPKHYLICHNLINSTLLILNPFNFVSMATLSTKDILITPFNYSEKIKMILTFQ